MHKRMRNTPVGARVEKYVILEQINHRVLDHAEVAELEVNRPASLRVRSPNIRALDGHVADSSALESLSRCSLPLKDRVPTSPGRKNNRGGVRAVSLRVAVALAHEVNSWTRYGNAGRGGDGKLPRRKRDGASCPRTSCVDRTLNTTCIVHHAVIVAAVVGNIVGVRAGDRWVRQNKLRPVPLPQISLPDLDLPAG